MHVLTYINKMISAEQLIAPMATTRVREIRKKIGLTQTEMARLLGYASYMRVSEIENGRAAIPDRVKLILLAIDDGWLSKDQPDEGLEGEG